MALGIMLRDAGEGIRWPPQELLGWVPAAGEPHSIGDDSSVLPPEFLRAVRRRAKLTVAPVGEGVLVAVQSCLCPRL